MLWVERGKKRWGRLVGWEFHEMVHFIRREKGVKGMGKGGLSCI
jgi:hypothetical protein